MTTEPGPIGKCVVCDAEILEGAEHVTRFGPKDGPDTGSRFICFACVVQNYFTLTYDNDHPCVERRKTLAEPAKPIPLRCLRCGTVLRESPFKA
jgi:hypothetical protein